MILPKTPFDWKADLGSALNSAFNAQLGKVTYFVASREYGHPAYVEVRGPRGGLTLSARCLVLGSKSKCLARIASPQSFGAGMMKSSAPTPNAEWRIDKPSAL